MGDETEALGHTYENGVCTVCGDSNTNVAVNTATGTAYTTLAEALNAAGEGDTVQLLCDTEQTKLLVTPGVTLDLNGYALTTNYAVAFYTAHIVDNAGGGKLVTGMENLVLDETNGMVPVYDSTGYIFTKAGFAIRQDTAFEGEGIRIKALACPVRMDVVDLLADGAADNNLEIMIVLTWDGANGTGSQSFVFTDAFLTRVYESNLGVWNQYDQMFTMTITGIEGVENLRANIVVVSGTNAEYGTPNPVLIK